MSAAAVLDAVYAHRAEQADTDDRADTLVRAVVAAAGHRLDDEAPQHRRALDRSLGLLPEEPKQVSLSELADRWGIA